jgi:dissimilatory sulfite reductase (desulfoviridin) alpha/beta subunit
VAVVPFVFNDLEVLMTEKQITTETRGCIVCGKQYQMLVVRDAQGKFIGAKVMSVGGRTVTGEERPLVACESHSEESVEAAVQRVFHAEDEEEE